MICIYRLTCETAGTSRLDDKGEPQVGKATSVRVPMLETGADQSVVAMKAGNAARAKGLSLSEKNQILN